MGLCYLVDLILLFVLCLHHFLMYLEDQLRLAVQWHLEHLLGLEHLYHLFVLVDRPDLLHPEHLLYPENL